MALAFTRTINPNALAITAAVLLIGAVGLLSWHQSTKSQNAKFWIGHTHGVIAASADLNITLHNAEIGQRDYLLTGEDSYLIPYYAARERVGQLQTDILHLTTDNPTQQRNMRAVSPLIEHKLEDLARTVRLRREGAPDDALKLMKTEMGQRLMDKIEVILVDINAEEVNLLSLRQETADRVEASTRSFATAGGFLGVVLLCLAGRLLALQNLKAIAQAKTEGMLRQTKELLETQVKLQQVEQEAGTRFHLLANNISQFAWITNEIGGVTWYNQRWYDYTGTTLEEMQGWGWQTVHHPDHVERVVGRIRTSFEKGEPWEDTFPLRGRDGQYRWFLSRALPVRDEQGRVVRWFGTNTDVTEQREAEARFRFATQAGELGVWELDLQSKKLTASPVCKENFGRNQMDRFTYEELQEAVHPDDRDRMSKSIDQSISTGDAYDIECRIVRPGGITGWVKMRARVTRAADGTPLHMAGISLDITERVLTGKRIRQSQRVEAVGRLTAGVAHDFNNVLQSLLGGIELALDQVADQPKVCAYLELALRAGQRGGRLTSHLLSFSRQQVLRPTALELPPLLRDLSQTLVRTLGQDVAVRIDVAPDLPYVFADAAYLDSALLNLALNARDAMPAGGELRIEANATGERVVITVVDTGEGMPAEVLAQACEPFFSTKGTKGSGLGLSMVQGFARQSGGELRIESVIGQGTRIEIALPVAFPPSMPPIPAAALKKQPIQGQGRILVVDDDTDLVMITAAFLQEAGFEVTTASDGNEALVKLSVFAFEALVTDYAMPGMNGTDLLLQVHAVHPRLPVLMITGYASAEGQDGLPSDTVILRKPFRRDDLLYAVKDLVSDVVTEGLPAAAI
jgi:PAS domain S-box-containing protein